MTHFSSRTPAFQNVSGNSSRQESKCVSHKQQREEYHFGVGKAQHSVHPLEASV